MRRASSAEPQATDLARLRAYCAKLAGTFGPSIDGDDLFSLGLEVLAKHCQRYGRYTPCQFWPHLYRDLIDELRLEYGRTCHEHGRSALRRLTGPLDAAAERARVEDVAHEELIAADTLREVLEVCEGNERHERIVRCRAGGLTLARTADAVGMTESGVLFALRTLQRRLTSRKCEGQCSQPQV